MFQVSQSIFLQALGCAIINSLWQFAFLWLIYFFINTVFKLSSKQNYNVALLLQVAGFLWFAGTFTFYYQQWNNISVTSLYSDNSSFSFIESSRQNVWLYWIIKAHNILPYLSIAYLLLLVFLSTKWIQAYFYTKEIRQNGLSKIHVDWRLFVQKLSEQLGIQRRVSIYLSQLVKAPLTIGFFKPVILIPLASINHLTAEQMEAVILHELAHIKRFDYFVNLLVSMIEVVMFFNPFMQLLSKHIKRERESSCDDWVLQYEYNAASYARALLKIALLQAPVQTSFAMTAASNKNDALLLRVKRMIEKSEKNFHYRHQLIALLFTTVILSFFALISPVKNNQTASKSNSKPEIIVSNKIVQLDNPLFNPVFFLSESKAGNKEDQQKILATTNVRPNRHLPQLAIPENKIEINLDEILKPVITHATVLNEKLDLLQKMKFSFDIDLPKVSIRKSYAPAIVAQIANTEKEVRKALLQVHKNPDAEQPIYNEGMMQNMQRRLEEIKAVKLNLIKNNVVISKVQDALTGVQNDANTITIYLENDLRLEDLQAMVEELKKDIEMLRQQSLLTQAENNGSTTYAVPAVAYTVAPSHTYSKEYTAERTRARGYTISSTYSTPNTYLQPTDSISNSERDEELYQLEIEKLASPASKAPTIFKAKTKRVIIHI